MTVVSKHSEEFLQKNKEVIEKAEACLRSFAALVTAGGFSISGCGCCGSPDVARDDVSIQDVNVYDNKVQCMILVDCAWVKIEQ